MNDSSLKDTFELYGLSHLTSIFHENDVFDTNDISDGLIGKIVENPNDRETIQNLFEISLQRDQPTETVPEIRNILTDVTNTTIRPDPNNTTIRPDPNNTTIRPDPNFNMALLSEAGPSNTATQRRGVRNLRQRLSGTVQGKLILHSIEHGEVNRRQLAKFLIEEKLSTDVNRRLSREIFEDMVDEIMTLIPSERREIYYISSKIVNKRKISCKGILYDNYCNKRKKFIKLGLIQKGKKNIHEKVSEEKKIPEKMLDDIQWLKNSFEPWTMVLQKWEQTHQGRFEYYSGSSIQEMIHTFVPFKNKLGWNLIEIDFKMIYPDKSDNLFLNWPLKRNIIFKKLLKNNNKEVKNLLSEFTEEEIQQSDISTLFMIPLFLNPKKMRGSTWRPSKLEVQEAFIIHVKSVADIEPTLTYRRNKYQVLKMTMQPVPIFVGEKITDITKAFVSINNILWEVESPLKAFDICFKSYQTFDAKYPPEAEMAWLFIQQSLYGIHTPHDNDFTTLKIFQCDI